MATQDTFDHIHGSILGLAVGDAIGTTVETMPSGSFEPLITMVGGGKFSVLPGQWTDDTSMALCVAESVVECQGYNPMDQLERFNCWYEGWHFNCCGELIDIGELSQVTEVACLCHFIVSPAGLFVSVRSGTI